MTMNRNTSKSWIYWKTWTQIPGSPQERCRTFLQKNLLSQSTRKIILQSEPRNRDISFDPPIMDKKLWNSMFKPAKKQDKNIRRVIYKVSSAIRPIDNTLRMVYASKPESTDGETYKTWLQMEQTVLNSRALILDALSFANELRREQALKATISPNYQRPIGKEEVFGE
ncbi:hypothetical protein GLOIN_2v1471446 [Rhizophagus irregularis DAOM 181602=DAOM 197198]|nr:hypothetical protein GLOIN_2v1471446 [Rhizophagus irregularis DAOM 181602=DAOM 197198]POG80704.1 hypothetical protein GLOIN_2v1471446 [Rhizophagus irregularis DAOM 181602=DAOM 197198]|eukprot:XP_025187570.1 hypothetical protein GLOIN_2v1471446 [Rhizophagus irregularis DAOM 181602=DAOM 197198]